MKPFRCGNRRLTLTVALTVALTLLAPSPAGGQQEQPPAVLLIMDASGSMNRPDDAGRPLIDGAKQALIDVVDSLPAGSSVGLRVYGHRVPNTDQEQGCQDTELIAPVRPLDKPAMKRAIAGFSATGFTPIGLSLQEAVDDLPPEGPRTIILVSDGEDTCAPPDPCEVARGLAADGIEITVETVGFFLDDDAARTQLECIADATGGSFRDVESTEGLREGLVQLSNRASRQISQGTPIEGTASPAEAPVISGGLYSDTILGLETLYYAVELAPGQRYSATVHLSAVPGIDGTRFLRLKAQDPDGRSRGSNIAGGTSADEAHSAQFRSDQADDDNAGTWLLQVETEPNGGLPSGVEFPMQIGSRSRARA